MPIRYIDEAGTLETPQQQGTASVPAPRIRYLDEPPVEGPGIVGAALQGALQRGPSEIGQLLDMLPVGANPANLITGGLERLGVDASAASIASRLGGSAVEGFTGQEPRAPVTRGERFAEAGASGLVQALPTLAMGPAGGVARLLELVSGAGGNIAASEAEAAGVGQIGQFGAGLAAGLAPTAAAPALVRGGRNLLQNARTVIPGQSRVERMNELLFSQVDELSGGDPARVSQALEQVRGGMEDQVERLYGALDTSQAPPMLSENVRRTARDLIEDSGDELAGDVSREIKIASEYPDVVSLDQLKRLRTRASQTARENKATALSPGNPTVRRQAVLLRDSVDDTLRQSAPFDDSGNVGLLQDSIQARANLGQAFDPKTQMVRDILGREDPRRAFRAVLSSRRPASELRHMKTLLADQPGGVDGLKRMGVEMIIGETLEETSPTRGLNFLRDNKAAMIELFGPQEFNNAKTALRRMRAIQRGAVNVESPIRALLEFGPSVVRSVTRGGAIGGSDVQRGFRQLFSGMSERQRRDLLAETFLDKRVAREMLGEVRPDEFNAWRMRMRGALRRAELRAGAFSAEENEQ